MHSIFDVRNFNIVDCENAIEAAKGEIARGRTEYILSIASLEARIAELNGTCVNWVG